jgi:hypothetical protein
MGFTQAGDGTFLRAVYVLYNEVLQNNSMAPSKLKYHYETEHSQHEGKALKFFSTVC